MSTVLYVDDNAENLRVLCLMIQRLSPDNEVLAARTAEEGINLAFEKRPNLILMDIGLPGMDGYEALNVLRGMDSLRHVPVIAVSAHAMPENISRGLAAGFVAYITKPVDMHDLYNTIKQFLPDDVVEEL